jgi:acyl-CoA thioester hydrolase
MALEVTEITHRVNYSETDQMGVVYHARYLIWLDVARCEHMRTAGWSYRELEELGFRLAVSEATLRYRQPARYDDEIRVRCWVREAVARRVTFGYSVEHAGAGRLLATARVSLLCLDAEFRLSRLPDTALSLLAPIPDPVRF